MLKKIYFSTALLAGFMLLFAGLASAQNVTFRASTTHPGPLSKVGIMQAPAGFVPAYCAPCLFYAGDSNPSSPNADGLWDNNSSDFGINGIIYTPFLVQKQKGVKPPNWSVTGIGGNIEYTPFPPTIQGVNWSIVTGVAAGGTPSSTTVICSGTDTAPTLTDTGRLFFGVFEEFNTAAAASGCPTLKATKSGTTYWQTNQVNTGGGLFQLAYESNTDVPPPNSFGPPQPQDDSFFYSPAFGFSTFTNTNQLGPFHTFSTDIEGSLVKK